MKSAIRNGLLALALSAVLLPGADQNLVNFSAPDANFIMGVRLAEVASSPLVTTALAEAQRSNPQIQNLFSMLGANPFQYLDEVLIAAKIDAASASKEPNNVLVALRGRFGDGGFQGMICNRGCETEEYRGFPVLRFQAPDSSDVTYMSVLDSSYAVIGKLPEIRGVIDRRATGSQSMIDGALQQGINRLGRNHLWLIVNGPFDSGLGAGGGALGASEALSKIDGFGFAVHLAHDVDMTIEVRARSAAGAMELYNMANGFLSLMKAGSDTNPEAKKLMEQLQFAVDGLTLRASIRIPEAEIRRQMASRGGGGQLGQSFSSQGSSGTSPAVPVAGVAPPPPAAKRRKGGILIHGLGNKPVEIETTPTR